MADNATHHLELDDELDLVHDDHGGYDYHDHPTDNDGVCGLHPEHTGRHNPTHDHHPAHHHDRNGSVIYHGDHTTLPGR